MAHITSFANIEFDNPVGSTAPGTITWFSLQTAAVTGGTQIFKDELPDSGFTPAEGATIRIPSARLDFNVPNGEMPDAEALLMLRLLLARRIESLDMNAGITDFTNTNGTVYVALHTGDPGDAAANEIVLGTGTNEADGTGYKRKSATIGNSGGTAADLRTALLVVTNP